MKIYKNFMIVLVLSIFLVSACKFIGVSPIGISVPKEEVKENISALPYIEPEIYELLKTKEWVRIIIILKEPNSIVQDEIINSFIEDEFKLLSKGGTGGWISGTITTKGLEKLKKDNRILRVYIPVPKKTLDEQNGT